MTVAVGMKFNSGVIVGADSEITVTDSFKLPDSKIAYWGNGETSIVLSGAGYWEFLRMAFERIVKKVKSGEEAESAIEDIVLDLYSRHIPLSPNKPEFHLVAGAWSMNSGLRLIKTEHTAITCSNITAFLGIGGPMANYACQYFLPWEADLDDAAIAALEALRLCKAFVPYCGGHSNLFSVRRTDGKISFFHPPYITKVEECLRRLEIELEVFRNGLINPKTSNKDFHDFIEEIKGEAEKIRKQMPTPSFTEIIGDEMFPDF